MEQNKILNTLTEIYRDITEEKDYELKGDSLLNNIPGWDSLANLRIISECEEKFQIKIPTGEIFAFQTVEDICQAIEKQST